MALSQKLKDYRNATEGVKSEDQLKEIRQMPLSELEKETIQFGKAKCGQTFKMAFEDGRWTDWFVTTYENSPKIEHAKYITYVTKRLDTEIMTETKGYPSKSKTKQVPMSSKNEPQAKMEPSWEEESEISGCIPIMETPPNLLEEQVAIVQEENHNMRSRMTQIEMAIQELITHVKALTPSQ
jgi:hypothetical protein